MAQACGKICLTNWETYVSKTWMWVRNAVCHYPLISELPFATLSYTWNKSADVFCWMPRHSNVHITLLIKNSGCI